MEIRDEIESDYAEVRALHVRAFPSVAEAELVDQLRTDGDAITSLVAVEDEVIGHVMFSRMQAPFKALGLAPVAVDSAFRRKGVADALIREGLRRAERDGWQAVFVLGSPSYYRRFGFDVSLAAGFQSPYAGEYFMALALQEGGLPCKSGVVSYAPAFDGLD